MRKNNSGIYCWTSPSGKKYVGQTNNLAGRKRQFLNFNSNYSSGLSKIDMARKKYNDKSLWSYEIIESCVEEMLNEREAYWIKKLDTFNNGYNSTLGGNGVCGAKFTDETKRMMSEKKIEYFRNHESPAKGRKMQAHVKEAIRIGRDEFLTRNGGGHMKGKHHSDKTKEKISLSKKDYYNNNPDAKKGQSDRLKYYYKNNPEALLKMSKDMKERMETGVVKSGKNAGKTYKEVLSDSQREWVKEHGHPMKGRKQSEESRRKMSISKKGKKIDKIRIPIVQLNLDGSFVYEWSSAIEAEEHNKKYSRSKICMVCKGKRKTCAGYRWMYKNDYDKLCQSSSC